MGKKRRGSQAFAFEQSEETLLQNENILKLYKNQTFEPLDYKCWKQDDEEPKKEVEDQQAMERKKATKAQVSGLCARAEAH